MFPASGVPATVPMIHVYDEETDIGTFKRGGRTVLVSMSLQGWWCEALHFGEMYFQTNYIARFSDEQLAPTQEEADAFMREVTSVISNEIASGVQFVFAPKSGPFITSIITYGNGRAKALADAIEGYNALSGDSPDAVIAALGVREEDVAPMTKMYAIGFRGDHYVTLPDPDYFGGTVEYIFDAMQEDGVSASQVVNLDAYESEGIFWDKAKRPGGEK